MAQTRMVIGTLNNPEVNTEEYLEGWSKKEGVVFVTGQLERGKEETPHIQYFVQCKDKKRIGFFKAICSKSHFEFVKYNNGADDYCNKEDTRLEGPFTFGVRPAKRYKKGDVKRRNAELLELGVTKAVQEGLVPLASYRQVKQSVDLYRLDTQEQYNHPEIRGIWIYGPPGVGKSHRAREDYPNPYLKAQNKWFDGYTGQHNILLDDHDNPCLAHLFKLWADRYACTGEIKGGTVPLLHRNFVVTSNFSIEELYKDEPVITKDALKRRFKVIYMAEMFKPNQQLQIVQEEKVVELPPKEEASEISGLEELLSD